MRPGRVQSSSLNYGSGAAAVPPRYMFVASVRAEWPGRCECGYVPTVVCVCAKRLQVLTSFTGSKDWDTKVRCDSCGNRCEFQSCRVIAKSHGRWRCKQCGTTHTQLRRSFGSWPLPTFSRLQDDVKEAFYRRALTENQNAVMKEAEEIMSTETTSDKFAEHGEFLPLSVWAQRGFPIDLIQERSLPVDKKNHPILGDTYRVRITSTTYSEERSNTRKSSGTYEPNPRAGNKRRGDRDVAGQELDTPLAGSPPVLALEDGRASQNASSSRSSSSSSSSSKKHKKKSKKDKKRSKKDKKAKKDACV